ncbi:hypothetical protein LJ737_02530 [Hymenobacter sp. 15J16-1T3B]|uniref:hypothetical protein n=1 Tax=Hymenobacter sp. 15J16-1T3B TaxID=2886941 RepID=UPI001D0FDFFC|nr:hypothetical protein [Hymenobacter sp. 15J16-1T3B]MCC3156092.1 hypothetical protein [Hymenobacter sp. 15J16-1T3B]
MNHRLFVCAALFSLLGLGACEKACDTKNLPQYSLTAGQQAWVAAAQPGTVWRFSNAAGLERAYRVQARETNMQGAGGGKSSFCPSWYQQEQVVTLARTDSADMAPYDIYLKAANPTVQNSPYGFVGGMRWGSTSFSLEILEEYDNQPGLPARTVNGHTYANVLELSGNLTLPNAGRRVVRLFLAKDDGVIEFEEQGGTVWSRI